MSVLSFRYLFLLLYFFFSVVVCKDKCAGMLSIGIKGCRRGRISISVIEMMMVVYTQELRFYLGSMLVMDDFFGFKM